jgi:hypothetical protein
MAHNSRSLRIARVPEFKVGPSTPWVSAEVVRRLLVGINIQTGVQPWWILGELGLSEHLIEHPGALIPDAVMKQLWEIAVDLTGDPVIGHRLGESTTPFFSRHPGTTTLATAYLDAAVALKSSVSGFTIELCRDEGSSLLGVEHAIRVELRPTLPGRGCTAQEELCILGNLAALARRGSGANQGRRVEPLLVEFRHSVEDATPYQSLFDGRAQLGAYSTALVFDARDLGRSGLSELPPRGAFPIEPGRTESVPALDETLGILQEMWHGDENGAPVHPGADIATFSPELSWLLTSQFGVRSWVS